MKRETLSFLTRELRSLGDVEVVDTAPDYEISVVALETSSRGSTVPTGYAVSAIVTAPIDLTLVKNQGEALRPSNAKLYDSLFKTIEHTTAGRELILGHYLRITSPDRLAQLCESLIAEIDGETFEGLRKSMREWKRIVDEAIGKSKKPQ